MSDWQAQYEKDVAAQLRSGPHDITEEQRLYNRQVAQALAASNNMPIPDIHKLSDCDLIYRFLIAQKWNIPKTIEMIKEYIKFRKTEKLDEILWEEFPEETKKIGTIYRGFDKEGHPVYCDRPDPKVLGKLLVMFPRELLLRVHYATMEEGRRLQKMYSSDRVTCIIDFNLMNMAMVTNPSAMGFMKELSRVDQTHYPENMRFMLICNGGWTFSTAYKMVKGWLDTRVQQKIHFMRGSTSKPADMMKDVQTFVDREQLTTQFGGVLEESACIYDFAEMRRTLPRGVPPAVVRSDPTHEVPEVIDDSNINAASPTAAVLEESAEAPSAFGQEKPLAEDEVDKYL